MFDTRGVAAIQELRTLIQPTVLAHERTLPVSEPLDSLLPHGGLTPGATFRVGGCTSLTLALVAAATREGAWAAVVGAGTIGWAAAADLGVDLRRVLVVPRVGAAEWPEVVAALVDSVSVVLLRPGWPVRERDARRLATRARERGAVLVVDGPARRWPLEAEVVLDASGSWSGLGEGHGSLRSRRVSVTMSGRRAPGACRRMDLWLPAADGSIRPALSDSGLRTVPAG